MKHYVALVVGLLAAFSPLAVASVTAPASAMAAPPHVAPQGIMLCC